MPFPFSAGNILTAADLNAALGGSTSTTFTPNFANVNGGTGPTLDGRYVKLGSFAIVHVAFTLGTGGSVAGTINVTGLPVTFVGTSVIGSAWAYDLTGSQYPGVCVGVSNAITQFNFTTSAATTAAPFTWAVGDQLRATVIGFVV